MAVPPFKVKAVYDYSSPHEDDLNFPSGQVITVTEKEDDDWYIGEYADASGQQHTGLFPVNFVEKYEPPVPSRPTTRGARPAPEVRSPPPPAPEPEHEEEANDDDDDDDDDKEEEAAAQEAAPSLPAQSKPVAPPVQTSIPPSRAEEAAIRSPQQAATTPAALQASERQAPPAAKPAPAPAPTPAPAPAPAAAPAEKKAPPPVSEKPSSFKDRIAAFNKAAAAPIAPFKPSGGQPSFIKKPFVAPPPSSNAYVPPPRAEPVQKVYRREEDPEIQEKQEQDRLDAEKAGLLPSEHGGAAAPAAGEEGDEEEAPKPQSLKERIAMLQKQQMEQAARRADATHKEKPKKPVKKHTDDSTHEATAQAPPPVPVAAVPEEHVDDEAEAAPRGSIDQPLDRSQSTRRTSYAPVSRTATAASHEPEIFSDANDADLSAAGETTEDNDADSDGTEPGLAHASAPAPAPAPASVSAPAPRMSVESARAPAAPRQEPDVGEEEGEAEESEEEDEVDAETRRREELRARMAKMSGGMGMAGMFGPPGGMMPGVAPPQKKKSTKESTRESRTSHDETRSPTGAPQIPMFAMPGMQLPGLQPVRSPEQEDHQTNVEREQEEATPLTSEREPHIVPDVEHVKPELAPRASLDRAAPPVPQERPLQSPPRERAAPPPIPGDRPVPHPPAPEARAVPPPPHANVPQSESEGSVSDDELSAVPRGASFDTTRTHDSSLPSRAAPPPVPSNAAPANPRSPPIGPSKRASYFQSDAASPTSPTTPGSDRRASRIPPIPGTGPLSPGVTRAPPPPPPTAEPFAHAPPVPRPAVEEIDQGESEYEGDYDTDIASGVKHKDALKSHARDISLDESTTADEGPLSPSRPAAQPPAPAPRAVPPPPPPVQQRMSVDAPRVAPPLPPSRDIEFPPRPEQNDDVEGVDVPAHVLPIRAVPPPPPSAPAPPPAIPVESEDSSDDMYSASPPRQSASIDRAPPPPPHTVSVHDRSVPATPPTQAQPPAFSPPSRQSTANRQSLDVPRQSMSARRSTDQQRPADHGYIASDVDYAEQSQWWATPDLPPPMFQNRNDVLVEIEESSTSRRGGRTTIAKDVYVLFLDYSQTIITARFDSREPTDVSFEQRHEAPPPRLRQDQLESFWQYYGARLSEAAASKKDSVVGDGSPRALVLELLKPFKDALLPVGTRAYGALVYANLANASVQQFDEIRPGDILTLRNAKLAGKHGTMHQKYSMDIKEHVAVVVDWDGTKKKVRAWEQGREKAKVRLESFRLGDLKSGEVRVWRIVGRQWVGWETGA